MTDMLVWLAQELVDLQVRLRLTELELCEMRDPTPPGCVRFEINGYDAIDTAEIERFAKREGLTFLEACNNEAAMRAFAGSGWEDEE